MAAEDTAAAVEHPTAVALTVAAPMVADIPAADTPVAATTAAQARMPAAGPMVACAQVRRRHTIPRPAGPGLLKAELRAKEVRGKAQLRGMPRRDGTPSPAMAIMQSVAQALPLMKARREFMPGQPMKPGFAMASSTPSLAPMRRAPCWRRIKDSVPAQSSVVELDSATGAAVGVRAGTAAIGDFRDGVGEAGVAAVGELALAGVPSGIGRPSGIARGGATITVPPAITHTPTRSKNLSRRVSGSITLNF